MIRQVVWNCGVWLVSRYGSASWSIILPGGIGPQADLPEHKSAASFNSIEPNIDDPAPGPLRESVRHWAAFAAHGEQRWLDC
jgi:hypothetical protein